MDSEVVENTVDNVVDAIVDVVVVDPVDNILDTVAAVVVDVIDDAKAVGAVIVDAVLSFDNDVDLTGGCVVLA